MPALDRSRPARMALALFGLAGAGVVGVISAGQRRPPRLDEKSPGRHEGPGPVCATGFWAGCEQSVARCAARRRKAVALTCSPKATTRAAAIRRRAAS
jgi:hypothetical protein